MRDLIRVVFLGAQVGLVVFIPTCTYIGFFSDDAAAERKAAKATREAQYRLDQQPRVIREVDACKVYAFKEGEHWHYFTRCPTTTTTERNYSETHRSGKNNVTVQKSEKITTENT